MLKNQTMDGLRELRLGAMAEAYTHQSQDPGINELSFDERLGLLVDCERSERKNRLRARLLREARLKVSAAPEEVDYTTTRGLDPSVVRQLMTAAWVVDHQNLIVSGPTGVGKTFLACAMGTAACRQGLRVRYYRLSRMFQEIALSKADGSYGRLIGQIARVDLLILDDWGLAPMSGPEGRDLLDILDDRSGQRSTCVVSQLPIDAWYGTFADPTVADAVLDRLVHTAHKIQMKGESMRKLKALLSANDKTGK